MNEYEYEPVRGLPETLPEGEAIVWQGEPAWRALACRVFHVRTLAIYFSALILLHGIYQWLQGVDAAAVVFAAAWQLGLAAVALSILSLLALAYSRSTVYTITSRRLVVRSGVAVPMMINIPWDSVESADLRRCRDGTGDIAFRLAADRRAAFWALWPNVHAWHLGRVQPMIRGIQSPEAVARLLAKTVVGESWTGAGESPAADVATGGAIVVSG